MMNKSFVIGLLSGVTITSLISLYLSQKKQKSKSKQSIKIKQHSKQLKQEQLARIIKFFGDQKFQLLEKSYVVVFGVGGVGSHVVNMIGRSGVGKIKIIDFDQVSLSSLNRHSCAVREDVGTSKVKCLEKHIKKILPDCQIQIVETYVTVDNVQQLIPDNANYIVDCIDNIDAKVKLIEVCFKKNIKLIVSGGAGMKSDPTKLQIRDISDCKYDALISRVKKQLSKVGIKKGIKVVYSYQQPQKQLLPLNQDQQSKPQAYKVFDNYRIRIVPVLGTMPAILGMSIASYVLCELAGQPYQPFETDYVKATSFNKIYCELINDEKKKGVDLKDMVIDMQEVAILAKEVYKWQCLFSKKKESHPKLVRWDPNKPATIDNIALMGKQMYSKHLCLKSLEQGNYSRQVHQNFNEKAIQAKKLLDSGYCVFI